MPDTAEDKEFSQRDVVLIVALASGTPLGEIAKYLNITHRAVQKYMHNHRDRIKPLADSLASFYKTTKSEIRREAIEDLMSEIKGLDGMALDAWVAALSGQDKQLAYIASKEQRDRRLGMPHASVSASVSVTGKIEHEHQHMIDPQVLALLEQDIRRDAPLIQNRNRLAVTGDVIDVEPD